jgi:hypothetical protein
LVLKHVDEVEDVLDRNVVDHELEREMVAALGSDVAA